jgi:phenylacetate-CoA ligase
MALQRAIFSKMASTFFVHTNGFGFALFSRIDSSMAVARSDTLLNTPRRPCECGRTFRPLEGGVIGRINDALIVRGVNVFPSAIENIGRCFSKIGEFAVDVCRRGELDELEIRIEVTRAEPDVVAAAVATEIRNGLGLQVKVEPVPYGTLPSFELKVRRFKDHRQVSEPLVQ